MKGWIKVHRKIFYSEIFEDPILFKLFMLCLLRAAHKPIEVIIEGLNDPIKLKPGQFITGRFSLHRDFYRKSKSTRGRAVNEWSPDTLWRRLKLLEKLEMLHIESFNKYSIITIINWTQYQEVAQQMHNRCTTDAHKQEGIKNEKETPDLFSLKKPYDQDLIKNCFDAIRTTRKSGKVAASVLMAQLQKWEPYPVNQVEAGIRVYLEKDYPGQGKDEKYLLGIIRNLKNKPPDTAPALVYLSQEELLRDA